MRHYTLPCEILKFKNRSNSVSTDDVSIGVSKLGYTSFDIRPPRSQGCVLP